MPTMMKKYLFAMSIFLIMIFFAAPSSAETVRYGYGTYENKQAQFYESFTIQTQPITLNVLPAVIDDRLMVPLRVIVENLGGRVVWHGDSASIETQLLNNTVLFRMNDPIATVNGQKLDMGYALATVNGHAMIPIDVLYALWPVDITVDSTEKAITIQTSMHHDAIDGLSRMSYFSYDDYFLFTVYGSKILDVNAYTVKADNELPPRLAIRMYGPSISHGQRTITLHNQSVQSIRYARYDERAVGVVFDLYQQLEAGTKTDETGMQVIIGQKPSTITHILHGGMQADEIEDVPHDEQPTNRQEPEQVHTDDVMVYERKTDAKSVLFLKDIVLEPDDYQIRRAASGLRFVIEIDEKAGVFKDEFHIIRDEWVNTVSSFYNRVTRYTRINIETSKAMEYKIIPVYHGERGTRIEIFPYSEAPSEQPPSSGMSPLPNPVPQMRSVGNLLYRTAGDRIAIELQDVQLTQGGRFLQRFYTQTVSPDGRVVTLTFDGQYGTLPNTTLAIHDGWVEKIDSSYDFVKGMNKLTIHMVHAHNTNIIYRSVVKNTTITILPKPIDSSRPVVLSAGHGGADPGAIHHGMVEKHLNLEITRHTRRVLIENGYDVYMMRDDDSYISTFERAHIANMLNAAIFVDIHNNAMHSPTGLSGMNGSMVFYHGSSTSGYRLSELILHELLTTLHTNDLGVRRKDEYVVLYATAMPASLVEVAFMTGDMDMANLTQPLFLQRAGEAIARGIMKYLDG